MVTQGTHGTRREPRVAVNIPVRLILEPDGARKDYDALLLDASEWGVRLVTGMEVSMGQPVELIPQEGPAFAVRGRVVWIATFYARHENHLGIQLTQPHSIRSWKG